MSIYDYLKYTDFIENQIKTNRPSYGYKSRLAEAAECQRSFISHVLNGQAHFTHEQSIRLANFWKLSFAEKEYFLDLVSLARAGDRELKDFFTQKLLRARQEQENLAKRIENKKALPEADAATYYSGWEYAAIHILITIPEFREVRPISERLGLHEGVVKKVLQELENLGLAQFAKGKWSATDKTIHIGRDSKFNNLNHHHWRQRALMNSFLNEPSDVHYTSVCSISRDDFDKIRKLVFDLIDESRKVVSPSKEEELFCLTCDWFKV